jgi:hypothetical protein
MMSFLKPLNSKIAHLKKNNLLLSYPLIKIIKKNPIQNSKIKDYN